jgi:hypothetical protein
MKPAIGFSLGLALALGGCLSNPGHIARDTYDRTQGTQQASLPEPCKSGEQRTYRPTPKTDRPTYDSVIPPSSDVPTRSPSECRRRR